jgi:NADPH:quinone reductase-like Zn-dependent oxidoreductase
LAQSLRAIRIGGKITLIGVLSGAAEINPMLIFARRANLQGISVGSTQMFEAMNRAIAVSRLKPIIDKVFSFDDAPTAYRSSNTSLSACRIRPASAITPKPAR